jgi:hypothetical protein
VTCDGGCISDKVLKYIEPSGVLYQKKHEVRENLPNSDSFPALLLK